MCVAVVGALGVSVFLGRSGLHSKAFVALWLGHLSLSLTFEVLPCVC